MTIKNGQIAKVHTKQKPVINIMDYLKMERLLRELQYILVEQNMLENLKMINHMDLEPLYGPMVINTLVDGKMEKAMEVELKYGTMEENTQEYLKMINYTVKELCFILMEKNT